MQSDMLAVLQILKEFGTDKTATLSKRDVITVEKKLGYSKAKSTSKSERIKGTLPLSTSRETLQEIKLRISQNIEKYCWIDLQVQQGQYFKGYGEVDNVLSEGKTVLAHRPGEVWCLHCWDQWSTSSQQHIIYLSKLLQANVTWRDRARFTAINMSGRNCYIKDWIESSKCSNLNHLAVMKHFLSAYSPFQQDFYIGSFELVLVNKFGRIDYIGEIEDIDLQKRIPQLMEQQNQNAKTFSQAQAELFSKIKVQNLAAIISEERVEEQFNGTDLICFTLTIDTKYRNGTTWVKPTVQATIMEGDQSAEEKVHSFLQHQNVEIQVRKAKYITIPSIEGAKCWECDKPLKQYPFYWLKWEEGTKFGCRQCVEAVSTIEGHHFKYEKNSVLLMGKWEKLAEKNLGLNIQPIHPKHIQNIHEASCNGCSSDYNQTERARYICQGCRMDPNLHDYVDFCQQCIDKSVKKELKMKKELQSQGHCLNHPCLRVLYNVKGYYHF